MYPMRCCDVMCRSEQELMAFAFKLGNDKEYDQAYAAFRLIHERNPDQSDVCHNKKITKHCIILRSGL